MDYDKFQIGDRIWSEHFGFGNVIQESESSKSLQCECPDAEYGVWITSYGSFAVAKTRPRTFFHAVYDTDEGMRDGIKRGEGLRRNGKTIDWDSLIKGCSIRDFENLLAAVEKAKARFIQASIGGGCE